MDNPGARWWWFRTEQGSDEKMLRSGQNLKVEATGLADRLEVK
jgi:hypothetical protein